MSRSTNFEPAAGTNRKIVPDSRAVYDSLRAQILSGVYSGGTPLREAFLAESFGVSRTPVREALARLLHDRLLVRTSNGMAVHVPDSDEIIQIYDLRIMLEGEAASQAARMRAVSDLLRLEGLLARDRRLSDPDDATRRATNLEFHEAVWDAAHNLVLRDLLRRLATHVVHAPHSTLSTGDRWLQSLDEHAELLDAMNRRDETKAQAIARSHMQRARELRLDLLRGVALSPPAGDDR